MRDGSDAGRSLLVLQYLLLAVREVDQVTVIADCKAIDSVDRCPEASTHNRRCCYRHCDRRVWLRTAAPTPKVAAEPFFNGRSGVYRWTWSHGCGWCGSRHDEGDLVARYMSPPTFRTPRTLKKAIACFDGLFLPFRSTRTVEVSHGLAQ